MFPSRSKPEVGGGGGGGTHRLTDSHIKRSGLLGVSLRDIDIISLFWFPMCEYTTNSIKFKAKRIIKDLV